jgi:hypothetical protein
MKDIDWLVNYLSSAVKSVVARKWCLTFRFNYLKMRKKLSFCRPICKQIRSSRKDDYIDSMSMFSSRVSMDILWLPFLKIIATYNDNFWWVILYRKKDEMASRLCRECKKCEALSGNVVINFFRINRNIVVRCQFYKCRSS